MSKPPSLLMRGTVPPLDPPQQDTIDLFAVVRILKRRLLTAAAAALVVCSAIVIVTLQQTPRYYAYAAVEIQTPEPDPTARLNELARGLAPDSTVVNTQVEIIRSRSIVERVVNELDLTNDPEFNPWLREESWLDRLKARVRGLIGSSAPVSYTPSEEELERLQFDTTASMVLGSLDVHRVGLTLVLNVGFTSTRAERAQTIANTFAEQYIEFQRDNKRDDADEDNQRLDARLEELRDRLRASEEAVEAYRIEHGLQPVDGSGRTQTLPEQQIADLSGELITRRAELAEAEARLSSVRGQIRRGGSAESVSEVLSSPLIATLRAQQAQVARDLAELAGRYGELHPERERVANELADITAQIESEVRRIVGSLESDVVAAREGVRSLESSIAAMRDEINVTNRARVGLAELERQAAADRDLYDLFLERYRATGEERELSDADATIRSRAVLPGRPSSPNTKLNFMLAIALGVSAGFAAALVSEMMDRGLRTGQQVEKVLGVAHISSLPRIPKAGGFGMFEAKPSEYVVDNPLSAYAEALRAVRAATLLSSADNPPKVIALTSALPGEGKTSTALALARVSMVAGSKTIVVDCDLRRRDLTSRAEVAGREAGLVEVLEGEADIEAAVVVDEKTGLSILPLSGAGTTSRDIFNTEAFASLLALLRSHFDLVILDCPPVLPLADARAIAAKTDAVVMVVRARKVSRDAAKLALDILSQTNCWIAGVVLNQVALRERGRSSSDEYYYYKKYASYYTQ